jgi:hypothetical protein
MNYFQPYPLGTDDSVASAWESQVKELAKTPWLAHALAECASDLFPRFAACYAQLCSLPRSARRALQHQLARSSELTEVLQAQVQRQTGRALQRKLAYSLAGAALLLALGQGVAAAATIKVTTNIPDINDGDRKCSLIEAIVNANDDARTFRDCPAGSGADTIVLPKNSIHTLTAAYDYSYGPTGLPLITSPITIQGNGAKIIRQQPSHDNPVVPEFRLIAVNSSGDLTLKQVNLSGGYSNNEDTHDYSGYGGAAFNNGNLTIIGSTISGNTAVGGGGVYNRGYLTIANSTISANSAAFDGGGLDNTGGTVTIRNSTISGNTVSSDSYWSSGGGVYNSGYLTIDNSTISGNTVSSGSSRAHGGGIYSFAAYLTLTRSTISDNTVSSNSYDADGGGIDVAGGTLIIDNSTISGNTVRSNSYHADGGGINNSGINYSYFDPCCHVVYRGGSLTITDSTISGNTVKSDSNRADGGGIRNGNILQSYPGFLYNYPANITITDSTISSNSVSSGSIEAFGGGVSNYGDVTIENSTVSGNTASSGSYPSNGGGVHNSYIGSTLTLKRSLISGNVGLTGPEIFIRDGSVIADDFNLFGNHGKPGVSGFTPGLSDIVPGPSVTLKMILGPLKNNGGPTQTHALVKGSPAVDVIPLSDPSCTGTDQRGVARPRGHGCDIGAFEK